ncbi:hypothetical protein ACFLRW_00980 [Acidobacteriota bacterium]
MKVTPSKQRIYSAILGLGAFILLFRTMRFLLVENALITHTWWVIALTFLEASLDLSCLVFCIPWFISNDKSKDSLPLFFGAVAAILHAARVLIYALGRTGLWLNFDIKPEYHAQISSDRFWVYFAAVLSVLGVAGVLLIWRLRKIAKKKKD